MSNNHTPKPPTLVQLEWMRRLVVDVIQGLVYNPQGNKKGPIGNPYKDGHFRISVPNITHFGHRLIHRSHVIWHAATGEWPVMMLDHEDRNPANDAFLNLRLATERMQLGNRSICDRDLPIGVYLHKSTGKYTAQIDGRYLGIFRSIKEAYGARCYAEGRMPEDLEDVHVQR